METTEISTNIKNQEWYQFCVDDCKSILVERMFNANEEIVWCKWEIGERICIDENFQKISGGRGNESLLKQIFHDIGIGEKDGYFCVQTFEKYPTREKLSNALDSLGKLNSWRNFIKLLSGNGGVHVSHNSGENEWYTPKEYIEAARQVMGSIDLDPASTEKANEIVQAKQFHTIEDDGLSHPWYGNVWMNPPYSQPLIDKFSEKLVNDRVFGKISQACVLVNNATETSWMQRMLDTCSAVCFISGRIKFIDKDGEPKGAPLQGQSILYFGKNVNEFWEVFSQFGIVFCRCAEK